MKFPNQLQLYDGKYVLIVHQKTFLQILPNTWSLFSRFISSSVHQFFSSSVLQFFNSLLIRKALSLSACLHKFVISTISHNIIIYFVTLKRSEQQAQGAFLKKVSSLEIKKFMFTKTKKGWYSCIVKLGKFEQF